MLLKLFSIIRNNHYKIQRLLLFVVATLLIVWMFPNQASFKYEFQKGKPWMHETLIASFDFPILKSDDEFLSEQQFIRDNHKPSFILDQSVYELKAEEFINKFDQKWAIDKNVKKDNRFTFFNLKKKKGKNF